MKNKSITYLIVLVLVLNGYSVTSAMDAHYQAEKTTVLSEGLNVAFDIHPLDNTAAGHGSMADGSIQEGGYADVMFRVTDEETGEPVSSLELAAWISLTSDKAEAEMCEDRVKRYIQGLLGLHADIDLNKYFILVMNDDATISVIDPIMGMSGITHLFDMIVLPERGEDWVLNHKGDHMYVTMPRVGLVAKIDTQRFEVLENIEAGPVPVRVAMQPGERYLWVGNDGMKQSGVTVIDLEKNRTVKFIPTGWGHHEIAFSDNGRFAYVTNSQDNTLSVIETEKMEKVATVQTGENPIAVVYSHPARAAYVLSEADGSILAVDADSHSVRYTIQNDPGPISLRFDHTGRWGFVVNFRENRVDVIDASVGRIIHRLPVGKQPHQIIFSHMYAYIRHLGTPAVSLIKLSDIGKDGMPAQHQVSFGNSSPGEYRYTSLADSMSPTGHMAMVIAANPTEKVLFHYMEGMMVPMGSYSTYGKVPRAVRVVDRSLKEVGAGTYTGRIRIPKQGAYNVSLLIKSPRVIDCFRFDAGPSSKIASNDVRNGELGIDYQSLPRKVNVGKMFKVQFRLFRDENDGTVDDLNDVFVTTARMPGNRMQRSLATPVGDGFYESWITIPEPGAYYAFVSIPSLGVDRSQLPYQLLQAVR